MTPEKLESAPLEVREICFEVPLYSEKTGAVLIRKTVECNNRFRATTWEDSTLSLRMVVSGLCSRPFPPAAIRVKTIRGWKTQFGRTLGDILPCSAEMCRHPIIWEAQVWGRDGRPVTVEAESYEAALLEGRRIAHERGLEEVDAWP